MARQLRRDDLDSGTLDLGGRTVPLVCRVSPRARRITLRIDAKTGGVQLTLPRGVPRAEGLAFAESQRAWLLRRLSDLPPRAHFLEGAEIPILGSPHVIRHAPEARRGVWREAGALWVSGGADFIERRVADYLKREAKREIAARAKVKAGLLPAKARPLGRVILRDTRSRWGSCAHSGDLSFSWRLILAPEAVLDYVVAHEVAHLAEMNHGPAFWRLVGKLTESVKQPKAWLRREGAGLHRYGPA